MAAATLTPTAAEQLDDLPVAIHARVLTLIERLRAWPTVSGAKPLSGKLAGRFRMRSGDYRLQFHVRRENMIVERIGHRDGFYED